MYVHFDLTSQSRVMCYSVENLCVDFILRYFTLLGISLQNESYKAVWHDYIGKNLIEVGLNNYFSLSVYFYSILKRTISPTSFSENFHKILQYGTYF